MPVPVQDPINSSTANGTATVFAYAFQIFDDADLVVAVDGITKTLNVDYTVSGVGNEAGGDITFGTAPAAGASVLRYRDTALKRETDYQENGDLTAATLDADFDRLWQAGQELASGTKVAQRVMRAPVGESLAELPKAADRADTFPRFDSSGQLVTYPADPSDSSALAADLASTTSGKGASLIGTDGGETAQESLDRLDDEHVCVDDPLFGARGWPVDDMAALQAAFDWSKANRRPIFLGEKRYYTSGQLDAGGAIIRSISGVAGGADPLYLKKPDGTYVFGAASYEYYFHSTPAGIAYTWAQMIAATAYGCAIVSDHTAAILHCGEQDRFDIEGVAIIGDHRKPGQYGMDTAIPTAYYSRSHNLQNMAVIGCGNHGFQSARGLELSLFRGNRFYANNGRGLNIDRTIGIDCATEYISFEENKITYNRQEGVYLAQARKSVAFKRNDISGNGQYFAPPGADPLLGYSRAVPSTAAAMVAGIRVNDVAIDVGAGYCFGLVLQENYGEVLGKPFHIRAHESPGTLRDLRLQGNQFIRAAQVATSVSGGGENGCMAYIDVEVAADWQIAGNYWHALDAWKFAFVPNRGNESVLFADDSIPVSTQTERTFSRFQHKSQIISERYIQATGRTYGNQTLEKSIGGLGAPGNVTTTAIAADMALATGNNTSNYTAVYSLTAHWQASNADTYGGYLLMVTRMPSGKWAMLTLATSSTSGFTGAPTIDATSGLLTIPASASFRYTLTRVDNQLTQSGEP